MRRSSFRNVTAAIGSACCCVAIFTGTEWFAERALLEFGLSPIASIAILCTWNFSWILVMLLLINWAMPK